MQSETLNDTTLMTTNQQADSSAVMKNINNNHSNSNNSTTTSLFSRMQYINEYFFDVTAAIIISDGLVAGVIHVCG